MPTPDVRVRLSAEGEQQVIAALRRVTSETKRSGGQMQRSIQGFNTSLSSTRTLLASLAATVSVGALVAFTRNASQAADAVGKLSQQVGASVANLSAVRAAALTANVSMEQLGQTLGIFNRRATEALGGGKDAAAAFKAIGVSLDSLKGKDAAERLGIVAEQFVKLRDSPEKAALALQLFGRSGAALIPLLNDLGEKGLAGATQRAQELGLVFSENTARAAQALNDDFTILQAQAQALGAQFVEGLAPAVHVALGGVSKDMGGAAGAVREFGQRVGKFLGLAILTFQQTADEARRVLIPLQTLVKAVGALLVGGPIAAVAEFVKGQVELEKFLDELEGRTRERLDRAEELGRVAQEAIFGRLDALPKLRSGVGDTEAGIIPKDESARKGKSAEQLAFEASITAFQAEQNKLDFEAALIQERMNAGVLSQVQGNAQLAALERNRLPRLRELAAAALRAAEAFKDPEAIERAKELGRTIEVLAIQVEASNQILSRLSATIQDTLVGELTNLFRTGIREAKSFGDALRGIALSVVDAIQSILSAELAAAAVRAAFRIFTGGFSAGGAVRRAEGGPVAGPGTATSDSIPAMLSNGEFVVRAAVVQRPGMEAALATLNRGSATPSAARTGLGRYAEGGLVSGGGGSGRLDASLTIGLESGLVLRELESPDGQRAVVRVVARNRRATSSALGS